MKTIATTALLFVMIAVGAAPAAQAHGGYDRHDGRFDGRHDARNVHVLARQLEGAADELFRDARRAAGRVDREEARALRTIAQLEEATDVFSRRVARRGPYAPELKRDLRHMQQVHRMAERQARAFADGRRGRGHDHGVHAVFQDLRQVDRLLAALDRHVDGPGRRVAGGAWRFPGAGR